MRLSLRAGKVLAGLPEHVEETVWDLLDAAAADPWGFGQWDAGGTEGEDVRFAATGQLSVVYFANRTLRHLSVLAIVWLG
ncbi:hypothetical protein WKI68_12845 [Streptomyces sp. MS1.HAVA.3]|uniref:Uncharacterized protein n=1 Tax=Streptomyces caledonius TaxID=3134107 RepID=A0ABU8U2N5_9ACTN